MDLDQWLDAEKGRANRLARHFSLTKGAVSQWRTNGVPRARMLEVRQFTKGAVPLEGMMPKPRQQTTCRPVDEVHA